MRVNSRLPADREKQARGKQTKRNAVDGNQKNIHGTGKSHSVKYRHSAAQTQLPEHLQKKLEIATLQKQARKKDWQQAKSEYQKAQKQLDRKIQIDQEINKQLKVVSYNDPKFDRLFQCAKSSLKEVEIAMQVSKMSNQKKHQMRSALDLAVAQFKRAEDQVRIFKQDNQSQGSSSIYETRTE